MSMIFTGHASEYDFIALAAGDLTKVNDADLVQEHIQACDVCQAGLAENVGDARDLAGKGQEYHERFEESGQRVGRLAHELLRTKLAEVQQDTIEERVAPPPFTPGQIWTVCDHIEVGERTYVSHTVHDTCLVVSYSQPSIPRAMAVVGVVPIREDLTSFASEGDVILMSPQREPKLVEVWNTRPARVAHLCKLVRTVTAEELDLVMRTLVWLDGEKPIPSDLFVESGVLEFSAGGEEEIVSFRMEEMDAADHFSRPVTDFGGGDSEPKRGG